MLYPPEITEPCRMDLVNAGVTELRTAADVDMVLKNAQGTALVVVNSVCGCAAGKARPGIAMALENPNRPDMVATVFAGADIEATDRARQYFAPYPPSSPSIGLLRNGTLIYMLERRDIEVRNAEMIAQELVRAFDEHCVTPAP